MNNKLYLYVYRQERERERERERIIITCQLGGGRKNKKCHLSGNAEVVPLFDVYPKGRATI